MASWTPAAPAMPMLLLLTLASSSASAPGSGSGVFFGSGGTGGTYEYTVFQNDTDVLINMVELCSQGCTATQSSTQRSASLAINNDISFNVDAILSSCSATLAQELNWWRVALPQEREVGYLKILNAGEGEHEKLRDFIVRVGNSESVHENPVCYVGTQIATTSPFVEYVRCQARGRFVFIELMNEALVLCKVEIFEELSHLTPALLAGAPHAHYRAQDWDEVSVGIGRLLDSSGNQQHSLEGEGVHKAVGRGNGAFIPVHYVFGSSGGLNFPADTIPAKFTVCSSTRVGALNASAVGSILASLDGRWLHGHGRSNETHLGKRGAAHYGEWNVKADPGDSSSPPQDQWLVMCGKNDASSDYSFVVDGRQLAGNFSGMQDDVARQLVVNPGGDTAWVVGEVVIWDFHLSDKVMLRVSDYLHYNLRNSVPWQNNLAQRCARGACRTAQSTTDYGFEASLAVDGHPSIQDMAFQTGFDDLGFSALSAGSCSSTTKESGEHHHNWWGVDLELERSVGLVKIWRRGDGVRDDVLGFQVYVGSSSNWIDNRLCYTSSRLSSHPPFVEYAWCGSTGRYVFIALLGDSNTMLPRALTLCEVEVMEAREPLALTERDFNLHGHYHAEQSDFSNRSHPRLLDKSGHGRHSVSAVGGVDIGASKLDGHGAWSELPFLHGPRTSGLIFPADSVPSKFTICSVTRYTRTAEKERILDALDGDWTHGHWLGRGAAYYGMLNVDRSITLGSAGDHEQTDWLVMCGKNDELDNLSFIMDGFVVDNAQGGTGGVTMTINGGKEKHHSSWAVSEIVVWDGHLAAHDMLAVSDHLQAKLRDTRSADSGVPNLAQRCGRLGGAACSVTQSSSESPHSTADAAIDGVPAGRQDLPWYELDDGALPEYANTSCSWTDPSLPGPSWWRLDMEAVRSVAFIKIFNNPHDPARLDDFVVRVGNEDDAHANRVCFHGGLASASPPFVEYAACGTSMKGRYLFIVAPASGLSLCEVEVFSTFTLTEAAGVPPAQHLDVQALAWKGDHWRHTLLGHGTAPGLHGEVDFVYGGPDDGIDDLVVVPEKFTICSVTRYTDAPGGEILSGLGGSWVHGHKDGQRGVVQYGTGSCDEAAWPDVDHGLVCSDCKVLVDEFDSKYTTCLGYCAHLGLECAGGWEESSDSCQVKHDLGCHGTVNSSDALCECVPRTQNAISVGAQLNADGTGQRNWSEWLVLCGKNDDESPSFNVDGYFRKADALGSAEFPPGARLSLNRGSQKSWWAARDVVVWKEHLDEQAMALVADWLHFSLAAGTKRTPSLTLDCATGSGLPFPCPTNQSSTDWSVGSADKAIDGKPSVAAPPPLSRGTIGVSHVQGGSCAGTVSDGGASSHWWRLDMQLEVSVEFVKIWKAAPLLPRMVKSVRAWWGVYLCQIEFAFWDGSREVYGTGGTTDLGTFELEDGEVIVRIDWRSGACTDGFQLTTNTNRTSIWFGEHGGAGNIPYEASEDDPIVGLVDAGFCFPLNHNGVVSLSDTGASVSEDAATPDLQGFEVRVGQVDDPESNPVCYHGVQVSSLPPFVEYVHCPATGRYLFIELGSVLQLCEVEVFKYYTPSSVAGLPHAHYRARDYDEDMVFFDGRLRDSSGHGRHSRADVSWGSMERWSEVGHGASGTVEVVAGGLDAQVDFFKAVPAAFTLCSVTRFTSEDPSKQGSILDGSTYFEIKHGHHSGVRGAASYREQPIHRSECDHVWLRGLMAVCWVVYEQAETHAVATSVCEEAGGRLATLRNMDENLRLHELISNASLTYAWIGLSDSVTEGDFVWVDGRDAGDHYTYRGPLFQNWHVGEPNNWYTGEHCVEIPGWRPAWNDLSCADFRPFVCEFEIEEQFPDSGHEPTDWLVMCGTNDHRTTLIMDGRLGYGEELQDQYDDVWFTINGGDCYHNGEECSEWAFSELMVWDYHMDPGTMMLVSDHIHYNLRNNISQSRHNPFPIPNLARQCGNPGDPCPTDENFPWSTYPDCEFVEGFRAVDGVPSFQDATYRLGEWDHGLQTWRSGHCAASYTDDDSWQWWRVDLGQSRQVKYIKIWKTHGGGNLGSFEVRVGDMDYPLSNPTCYTATATSAYAPFVEYLTCEAVGRFVFIVQQELMILCEVEVYGDSDLHSIAGVPYAHYKGSNWTAETQTLHDISGNGRDGQGASRGSTVVRQQQASGSGSWATVLFVSGGLDDGIEFPADTIPDAFTICSVSRYTNPDSTTQGTILGDGTDAWAHGHRWHGRGAAYYGSAKVAMAQSTGGLPPATDWLVMCGKNDGTDPMSFVMDGRAVGDAFGGSAGSKRLVINGGQGEERSEWAVLEIVIWEGHLSAEQMVQASDLLHLQLRNQVSSFGKRPNVARLCTSGACLSRQSSTADGFLPNLATDGHPSFADEGYRFGPTDHAYSALASYSCSMTAAEEVNWWMLDMEVSREVDSVKIWGRGDCCSEDLVGFEVRVGNNAKHPRHNPACYVGHSVSGLPPYVNYIQCRGQGRYLFVVLAQKPLVLCEVEVFEKFDMNALTGVPWRHFRAADFDEENQLLPEANGRSSPGRAVGTVSKVCGSGHGQTGNSFHIFGNASAGVLFDSLASGLPEQYTLCSVSRYTGEDPAVQGRILDALEPNWFHGHADGHRGAVGYGMANLKPAAGPSRSGRRATDWLVMCGSNNQANQHSFIMDGIVVGQRWGGDGGKTVTINRGFFEKERSEWALTQLVVWDLHLDGETIQQASDCLHFSLSAADECSVIQRNLASLGSATSSFDDNPNLAEHPQDHEIQAEIGPSGVNYTVEKDEFEPPATITPETPLSDFIGTDPKMILDSHPSPIDQIKRRQGESIFISASELTHSTCAHSGDNLLNWFMVQLPEPTHVAYAKLFNRQDCCWEQLQGFEVRVGNESTPLGNPVCYTAPEVAMQPPFIEYIRCGAVGSYVYVVQKKEALVVCELELYGLFTPADIAGTPFAHYRASSLETHADGRIRLLDVSGRPEPKHSEWSTGDVRAGKRTGNGAWAAVDFVQGGKKDGIRFPAGSIPAQFTICSVTRYTSTIAEDQGRILDAVERDWLHGHAGGQWGLCGGARGSAYYDGWQLANFTTNASVTDWLVMCGKNDEADLFSFIVDGNVVHGSYGGEGGRTLTINDGSKRTDEASAWAVSEILIWDYLVDADTMMQISDSLHYQLRGKYEVQEECAAAEATRVNAPRNPVQHVHRCGTCVFWVDNQGVLDRYGSCDDDQCVILEFEGLDIASVAPGALQATHVAHLSLKRNAISKLQAAMLSGLPALETIDLSLNRIVSVEAGAFAANVKEVNLSANALAEFDGAWWADGVPLLERLDLANNQIGSIAAGAFTQADDSTPRLPNLSILSLDGNALYRVEAESFRGLQSLKELSMEWNYIRFLEPDAFAGLDLLELLSLANNGIQVLASRSFGSLPALRELQLQRNDLEVIGNLAFEGLDALESLYLQDNALRSIEQWTWLGLPALRFLQLANNRLRRLRPSQFWGLLSLGSLVLDGNCVRDMGPAVFDGVTQLANLSCRSCCWSAALLEQGGLVSLASLEQLDLANNSIARVTPQQFAADMSTLRTLDLSENEMRFTSNCKIEALEAESSTTFVAMPNLRMLKMDHNHICLLPANLLEGLSVLEHLNLSSNGLQQIRAQDQVFASAAQLAVLDLSNNALTLTPEGIFFGLSNLIELHLQDNAIQSLQPNTYESPFVGKLERLYLHRNRLVSAGIHAFANLISLKVLRLDSNRISAVDSHAFKGLYNLEELHLEENHLSTTSQAVCGGSWSLSNLQRLFLQKNSLASVRQENFKPGRCPRLEELDLSMNKIDWIQDAAFKHIGQLQQLRLHSNPLSVLDDIYPFSYLTSLTVLSLRMARVGTVVAWVFYGLSGLQELDLQSARIHTIEAWAFSGLDSLHTLRLGYNFISFLAPQTFVGLESSLLQLHLSHNNLREIYPLAFAGLGSVSELHLRNNLLTALSTSSFDGLSSLKALDLRDNQIANIHADVFSPLLELRTLQLCSNALVAITPQAFRGLNNLTHLSLTRNGISTLQANALSGLPRLEYLDLSQNILGTGTLRRLNSSLKSLHTLDLSHNLIDSIALMAFADTPELRVLILSDNRIADLLPDSLGDLQQLEELHLQTNAIAILHASGLRGLSSLRVLDLHSNPLSCLPVVPPSIELIRLPEFYDEIPPLCLPPGCATNLAGPQGVMFHLNQAGTVLPTITAIEKVMAVVRLDMLQRLDADMQGWSFYAPRAAERCWCVEVDVCVKAPSAR